MEQLRIGIAGLGRLGRVHAFNLACRIPNAKLTAACARTETSLAWARSELGIQDTYTDFNEMLQRADMDAVAIVTTSSEHCWQIEAALNAGKHVFCEKPLGIDLEQCQKAETAVLSHPELIFSLGFMRRYDASYRYAKEKIQAGAIGTPNLYKATAMDPESVVQDAIRFAKNSGGIFLDLGIHDIDLMRWFLGSEAVEVHAMGTTFKYPQFREAGEDETGAALYRFANGALGMIHLGRIAPHGYHIETEIVGTEGSIRISAVPEKNLAKLYTPAGVCTECVQSFPERFAQAYLDELQEFCDCVLTGRKPEGSVQDGTRSALVGYATVEACRTGRIVRIGSTDYTIV